MSTSYTWTRMLDEFRQLGGKAENIEQRTGQYGNGIFPIDPARPVEIHIPDRLLVDTQHIVLAGEDLVVDPGCGAPAEVCDFIARYQKHFSWGADGRRNVEAFEHRLKTLPESLQTRLREIKLQDLAIRHKGEWIEVLRRQFLQSRRIRYQERTVSMPIIELINHSAKSPGYKIGDGIQLGGSFAGEVTVRYSADTDPLARFFTYGFAYPEPVAYSLALRFRNNLRNFEVDRDFTDSEKKDELRLPKAGELKEGRKLAYLMLGHQQMPRMPRTVLRKTFPDLPVTEADELFDRIRNANILELCHLLELADGVENEIGKEFRRAVLFQIRALSHCFGLRPDPEH